MRKLVASALLAGLVLVPAAQASAAVLHGGGSGAMLSRLEGLARLAPMAGSHVAGGALIDYNPQEGKLDVTIEVTGLAPNSSHPAHIHLGPSCKANGPVIYPLPTLVANANGVALASTSIDARIVPASGWYVNVHQGPGLTGAQFTPISCGVVRRASALALINSQAGSSVQGVAFMARHNGKTDVVVLVNGLDPNTTHPEHIHQGMCGSNGPVIYPLPTLKADDNGIAVSATTINAGSIPASGWYVNVHQGPGLTGAQFTPIGCGNVIRTT